MLTSTNVANQAINLIGDNMPAITGVAPNFDSSTAGKAAAQFYALCVNAAARQFGWDFARKQVVLTPTGNSAPLGFLYEYAYPSNGVQVWQIMPGAISDPNNPLPVNWTIGNAVVASVQAKVIWCNLPGAIAIYNNAPNESTWDPLFQMAVVRLLANAMSMAIAGKPDVAEAMLQSGAAFEKLGESRDD